MNKAYTVYKRISPDGRIYVGCTSTSLSARAGPGGCNYRGNLEFWKAIKEFGWDNFKTEIILETEDIEEATEVEYQKIIELNTTNPEFGFNRRLKRYIKDLSYYSRLSDSIKKGMTAEVIAKKRETYFRNLPKFRANLSKSSIISNARPEVKEKIRAATIRRMQDPENIENIKKALARYWTPDRRKSYGNYIREKLSDSNIRKKISENTKKALEPEAVRLKMSKASSEKWKNPEYHDRVQKRMKEACNTPEHRQKLSEIGKVVQNRIENKEKLKKHFTGLIFINNGEISKRVTKEEAAELLKSSDWVLGRKPSGPRGTVESLQGRLWITKEGKSKFIPSNELSSYLEAGWKKGRK